MKLRLKLMAQRWCGCWARESQAVRAAVQAQPGSRVCRAFLEAALALMGASPSRGAWGKVLKRAYAGGVADLQCLGAASAQAAVMPGACCLVPAPAGVKNAQVQHRVGAVSGGCVGGVRPFPLACLDEMRSIHVILACARVGARRMRAWRCVECVVRVVGSACGAFAAATCAVG